LRLYYIALALLCLPALGPACRSGTTDPDAPPWLLAYHMEPGKTLRYKLTADIRYHGPLPISDSPTPADFNMNITLVYNATPKAVLEDGTADVEFTVESAEAELEKVPLPLPLEQVQQVLNQTVTLDTTGEVKKVQGGDPLPFSVSVPGVDPKRLYALLFPIVFRAQPVKVGDKWPYRSELLGGEGAAASFIATVLPAQSRAPFRPARAPKKDDRRNDAPPAAEPDRPFITQLGQRFQMTVDQKVDKDRKPVTGDAEIYRTRKGRIEGSGAFQFDRMQGRFTQGIVYITANITDNLVGQPLTPKEPKKLVSKVRATVKVELQPAPAGTQAPEEK
jgi:hypothetical protein